MLILTRRVGESLIIGDKGQIQITVVENKGGQIKLGIIAPKAISVHRQEVFERIQKGSPNGNR